MFYIFIAAQAFSLSGGYIQSTALSWAAAELGGGPSFLAAYLLACYLPVALLAYPFGRFLDRRPQKPWLLGSELALAALSLLLWLAAKLQFLSFPFLLLFGGGWGMIRAVQTPIYQSLPRRLARDLNKGTALLTVVTCAARGLGPILGGLLYAKFRAPIPFLVNFISFLPSLALLCFLKLPQEPAAEKPPFRKLLPPLLKIFLVSFFGVHYNVTFVSLVKKAGMGSSSYGIALGLLGTGALIGFFIKMKIRRPPPSAMVIGGMGLLNAALLLPFGLWWQGICILLYGLLDFWFFSQSAYRLAKAAEKTQITAAMGLYTAATIGAMPLGSLLWSATAKARGLNATLLAIAAGLMTIAISIKRMETYGKST